MSPFRPRNLVPFCTLLGAGAILSRQKHGSTPSSLPKKSGCSSKTLASRASKASPVPSLTTPGLSRVRKSRTHSSRYVTLPRPCHCSITTLTIPIVHPILTPFPFFLTCRLFVTFAARPTTRRHDGTLLLSILAAYRLARYQSRSPSPVLRFTVPWTLLSYSVVVH